MRKKIKEFKLSGTDEKMHAKYKTVVHIISHGKLGERLYHQESKYFDSMGLANVFVNKFNEARTDEFKAEIRRGWL